MSSAPRDLYARSAYEAFAASYDTFNHLYQYERWTGKLLEAGRAHGLEGNRLLDVACGTGLSFIPLLERGWSVTGCDISPAMLDIARAKVGDAAELLVADMRDLPVLGEFDLVWSVNDSLNYLLSIEDLQSALASMARNLAPRGMLLFDLNTLLTYEALFCDTHTREVSGDRFVWRGQMTEGSLTPGGIFEALIEAEGRGAGPAHRQRHFPESDVLASIEHAGLQSIAVLGERDGDLEQGLDEAIHTKAVYLCSSAGSADLPAAEKS